MMLHVLDFELLKIVVHMRLKLCMLRCVVHMCIKLSNLLAVGPCSYTAIALHV